MAVLVRRHGPGARVAGDAGDIVLSWLTKIALVLGVAGIALFDAISIGTTAMTVQDQGSYAARDASETWQTTHSLQKAYDTAVATAKEQNPANVVATDDFRVDEDGTVHLSLSRDATTLVVFRLGPTHDWAHVTREASGRSVS